MPRPSKAIRLERLTHEAVSAWNVCREYISGHRRAQECFGCSKLPTDHTAERFAVASANEKTLVFSRFFTGAAGSVDIFTNRAGGWPLANSGVFFDLEAAWSDGWLMPTSSIEARRV